jgi:beta-carotene 15,15'-dioxygenase
VTAFDWRKGVALAAPFLRAQSPLRERTYILAAPPVSRSFWILAAVLATLYGSGVDLQASGLSFLAIALFLLGGLPHGAFDIVLARLVFRLSRSRAALLFAAYVGVAGVMAAIWWVMPGLALALFLAMAAYHFGEDWTILDDRLLRTAVGAAPLAAASFGQFEAVATVFMMMAGQSAGSLISVLLYAMSPIILLVTAIALVIAFQRGARTWSIAMATALATLLVLPPLIGFALYFACLHSPRHLHEIQRYIANTAIAGLAKPNLWLHGGAMTGLALAAFMAAVMILIPAHNTVSPLSVGAGGFILLSVLAVPHLLLSNFVSTHIARNHASSSTSQ